jgi:hypothetical protein
MCYIDVGCRKQEIDCNCVPQCGVVCSIFEHFDADSWQPDNAFKQPVVCKTILAQNQICLLNVEDQPSRWD